MWAVISLKDTELIITDNSDKEYENLKPSALLPESLRKVSIYRKIVLCCGYSVVVKLQWY